IRDAGAGMAEVIAAHEFVHALGHEPHNTHLMAQTLNKMLGDRAAGDKLQAGAVAMPPPQRSDDSIEMLKGIWSCGTIGARRQGGRPAMSDNAQDLSCLAGIRIVDFTQFEAGTSCTEALAWLGAEVVKIENPKTGDPGRRLRPGKPDDDPWYFHMFNANKKSLAINLKSPRRLEIVKELLKKADVTVENMAPGTIERLGLGYDEVKKLNPRIIFCQIQGFGTGSKYESGLAFDMIAQAAGGTISVTGEPDRPPVKPGPSFGDTGTGMLMTATILAALLERQRTGKGRRLHAAM